MAQVTECTPLIAKNASGLSESSARARRKLITASSICFIFMCAEFAGGYIANSLAVMTDAAHLFSDITGFVISIAAITIAARPASASHTFGFHRAEIIGAMFSIFLIWVLTLWLVYEAVDRLLNGVTGLNGKIMFITAACGFGVNIIMFLILGHEGHSHSHGGGHAHGGGHSHAHGGEKAEGHGHSHGSSHGHGHGHESHSSGAHASHSSHSSHSSENESKSSNINVRAAMIHIIGDFVQTIGVMIAAVVIWIYPHMWYFDPVCTFLFSILVVASTVPILKESLSVLMEATPAGLSAERIETALAAIPGVAAVHDLHVWSISSGRVALAVHLEQGPVANINTCDILHSAQDMLRERFKIDHTTIQVEGCAQLDCQQSGVECPQTLHATRAPLNIQEESSSMAATLDHHV